MTDSVEIVAQAAIDCAGRLTEITSLAALTAGMSGKNSRQFARALQDLAVRGVLRRFRFDGRLHFAPVSRARDAAFVARFALESTACGCSEGACMPWSGKFFKARQGPVVHLDGKEFVLRRVIYEAHTGKRLAQAESVRPSCGEADCIHPQHLVKEPRNKQLIGRARLPSTRAKLARAQQAKAPYSMSEVQALRARCIRGELTRVAAAKSLGVSVETMERMVNGQAWRDFSNPYQSLTA